MRRGTCIRRLGKQCLEDPCRLAEGSGLGPWATGSHGGILQQGRDIMSFILEERAPSNCVEDGMVKAWENTNLWEAVAMA